VADQSTTIEVEHVADSSCSSVTAGERHTATDSHLPDNTAVIAPNMRTVSALARGSKVVTTPLDCGCWAATTHRSSTVEQMAARWRVRISRHPHACLRARGGANRVARQVQTARAAAGKADSLPRAWELGTRALQGTIALP
jgi:hypothetical protein